MQFEATCASAHGAGTCIGLAVTRLVSEAKLKGWGGVDERDVVLLKAPIPGTAADKGGPDVRWSNYCRSILAPMHFYRFGRAAETHWFWYTCCQTLQTKRSQGFERAVHGNKC